MPPDESSNEADTVLAQTFATTHWSVVTAAAAADSEEAHAALEALCRAYWYPLYAYVRRTGRNHQDAEDVIQSFFARLVDGSYLRTADPQRGRFRSFLLVCLRHFLSHEFEKSQTLKRGGRHLHVSWDGVTADERYQNEPLSEDNPERFYEMRWAFTVLQQVMDKLRDHHVAHGKTDEFELLKGFLGTEPGAGEYEEVAQKLNSKANTVAVTVMRLRQRYAATVRQQIANTVSNPADVDAELSYLIDLVGAARTV